MRFTFPVFVLFLLSSGLDVHAGLVSKEVTYGHEDILLKGYLVFDDKTDSERPGVLVVHEWWGLNVHAKQKADALAREGYIALALDMYGEGRSTEHPKEAGEWSGLIRKNREIGRKRFLAAYVLLQGQPFSMGDKIAAIGYCFGGNVVLSMAQEDIDLRGVVSFHGSLPTEPAPNPIKTKILVCNGAEDPLITQDQIVQFQKNMIAAGADWQFVQYGGAKHSFTNPEADKRGIPALGYNRSADERSWKAMLAFFEEVFSD